MSESIQVLFLEESSLLSFIYQIELEIWIHFIQSTFSHKKNHSHDIFISSTISYILDIFALNKTLHFLPDNFIKR